MDLNTSLSHRLLNTDMHEKTKLCLISATNSGALPALYPASTGCFLHWQSWICTENHFWCPPQLHGILLSAVGQFCLMCNVTAFSVTPDLMWKQLNMDYMHNNSSSVCANSRVLQSAEAGNVCLTPVIHAACSPLRYNSFECLKVWICNLKRSHLYQHLYHTFSLQINCATCNQDKGDGTRLNNVNMCWSAAKVVRNNIQGNYFSLSSLLKFVPLPTDGNTWIS